MVRTFQEEVCQHTPSQLPHKPSVPNLETITTCIKLIKEEAKETEEALWKCVNAYSADARPEDNYFGPNSVMALAEVADGLVDEIYVCLYTANRLGLDLSAFFEEAQRTNMLKKGGIIDKHGKLQKPPGWEPPHMATIVLQQVADAKAASNG